MNLLGQITSWSAIAYFVCFSATFNAQATLNNASLSERIIEMKRSADWQHMQILGMELLREPTLNGAAKIDVLLSLSKAAYDSNQFKDALNYLSQLELATRTKVLSDNHFKAVKLQGISNFYLGHYQQAIDFYTRALALAEQRDMPIETANLHSNLGLAYFKNFSLDLALQHYLKADELYQEFGSAQDHADILLNISGVYIRQAAYEKAESMLLTALQAFNQLNDEYGAALAHADLGVLYTETKRPEMAQASYLAAIDYYEAKNDVRHLSYEYVNLALLSYSLGQLEEGEKNANFALYYAEKAKNPANLMEAQFVLAKILFAQGKLEDAFTNAEQSLIASRTMHEQEKERTALRLLALIEAARGNIDKARNYDSQNIEAQKRLMNEDVLKRLNDYRAKYEASELSREVEVLKQEQRLQRLKEEQRSQLLLLGGIIAVLTLLTAFALYRRKVEQKAKLELSQKVALRTSELQQKADELRAANQVKSQFLANMSHEIRTPLTTVLGHAEDLLAEQDLGTQVQASVQTIYNQGLHLRDLVNDILDLSRIEAERLALEATEFSVSSLVADLCDMFQQNIHSKQLEFIVCDQVRSKAYVRLDYIRVKQILINLLSNALKFTEQGRIEFSVSEVPHGLQFKVVDTGIGMSEQQIARIFESFQQADNSITRRFGGSGLGLSLSSQLANMMNGEITVQSALELGSTFSFFVPCTVYLNSTVTDIQQPQQAQPLLSGNVLVVEDHAENRQLFSRMIERTGATVTVAENGARAVEQCLSDFPDLVLMDIQMPRMDGVEALNIIRSAGYSGPIYALTANVLTEEVKSYIDSGFNGHIGKPINKNELLSILNIHLSSDHASSTQQSINIDLTDLRDSFASTFEQERYLLIDAWQNKDFVALQASCHKLAGAASMFEFPELASIAIEFEKALKHQSESQYQSLFLALCDQLKSQESLAS
ncbi:response regulator [Pseudoalteromonas sp. McH1-7]|uniref:response regulator n=1 Tax=Pseudoalteromonas TaxID=53246 RepID=UPI0015928FC2|nr:MULTISPECIES: response regulator [Pseudoalteromonas]MDW7551116.1 response regulator [Pseudoalteromonas peptidolytica]NUZ12882.1 response regulator [Pseudoalteromonas sp. McH1-7]USD28633.1 response regulator [Pseudoalteromonas sp. SCSIO 43201]